MFRSVQDSEHPNVVPERPVEREVGFSIDLVDPGYRELLDDPDSPQYNDLAHHLQDQVRVWAPLGLCPEAVTHRRHISWTYAVINNRGVDLKSPCR